MKINTNFLADFAKSKYKGSLPDMKQKKTQEITTIALTLITLSLFGLFAINPTISAIAQLQRELSDSQDVNQKLDQKIRNLALLQQQYGKIQNEIAIVNDAIPSTPESAELTAQLQAIAQNHSVSLIRSQIFQVDLSSASKQKIGGYGFAFSLTAEGSYDNISDFLRELVNFDRITTTENITITNGPDGSNRIQLNVRGRGYYKP